MTKESKLALILSFVLILVVGVLISDHFSHASSMRDGIDAPDAGHAVESIDPVRPLPESAAYRGEGAERAGSVLERLSDSFGSVRVPELASTARDAASEEPDPAADDAPVVLLNTRPDQAEEPSARARTTRVRAGESLYAIARRTLGDGGRWREIQRLNRGILGDSTTLRVGMTLQIPGSRVSEVDTARASPPGGGAERTHVVAPGEYLGKIAQEYLGTVSRMDEIVVLNGLDDADDIRVGMKLRIPPE